ncbi:uncharacterized protein LOC133885387 [Phragmites australis]|uniref:uncharacterized protein LOC133885387 n=1 Tax=Phragmites australis TaxID=29695 RepID=UPI002D771F78|nr:uncharacterized protein LOC133885387 [Phragmites australis]
MAAAADRKGTQASQSARSSDDPDQPAKDDGRAMTLALDGRLASCWIFLAYSLVQTARRVRDRPWDLAFVVLAYADLAALFWCLPRAERLPPPPSPAGGEERRRLQLAVWALSTALSCALAHRVSLIMPAALVIVVWSMTSFVVLVGFYLLVVCKDQGYRVLEDDDGGGGGDGKGFDKKIGAGDELV